MWDRWLLFVQFCLRTLPLPLHYHQVPCVSSRWEAESEKRLGAIEFVARHNTIIIMLQLYKIRLSWTWFIAVTVKCPEITFVVNGHMNKLSWSVVNSLKLPRQRMRMKFIWILWVLKKDTNVVRDGNFNYLCCSMLYFLIDTATNKVWREKLETDV